MSDVHTMKITILAVNQELLLWCYKRYY